MRKVAGEKTIRITEKRTPVRRASRRVSLAEAEKIAGIETQAMVGAISSMALGSLRALNRLRAKAHNLDVLNGKLGRRTRWADRVDAKAEEFAREQNFRGSR